MAPWANKNPSDKRRAAFVVQGVRNRPCARATSPRGSDKIPNQSDLVIAVLDETGGQIHQELVFPAKSVTLIH